MNVSSPLKADVLIAAGLSPAERQDIIDALASAGVAAHPRMIPAHRGAGELQWLVLASLPLQAFLSGLGSAMAENVSETLKRIVGRIRQTQHPAARSNQILVLQDTKTRLQVVLEADLPAEAYEALVSIDLSKYRKGPLHYDWQRHKWRSELDEWEQPGESQADDSLAK
jgi:hypothetical protein